MEKLNDSFSAGQILGMMVVLTYIENNNGIEKGFLDELQEACAAKTAGYLEKPVEDVYLMVETKVKEIHTT